MRMTALIILGVVGVIMRFLPFCMGREAVLDRGEWF